MLHSIVTTFKRSKFTKISLILATLLLERLREMSQDDPKLLDCFEWSKYNFQDVVRCFRSVLSHSPQSARRQEVVSNNKRHVSKVLKTFLNGVAKFWRISRSLSPKLPERNMHEPSCPWCIMKFELQPFGSPRNRIFGFTRCGWTAGSTCRCQGAPPSA